MVWPIMRDACRRSIHLRDGVEASQRDGSFVSRQFCDGSFRGSALSSILAFNEQYGTVPGQQPASGNLRVLALWEDDGQAGSNPLWLENARKSRCSME